MKIPDSIRIGGVEYPIEYVANLRYGNERRLGQIGYIDTKIELDDSKETSHDSRCITLLHEILHGISNHAGMEAAQKEDVVDMFAKGIYQVLQDNGARLFDLKEDKAGD